MIKGVNGSFSLANNGAGGGAAQSITGGALLTVGRAHVMHRFSNELNEVEVEVRAAGAPPRAAWRGLRAELGRWMCDPAGSRLLRCASCCRGAAGVGAHVFLQLSFRKKGPRAHAPSLMMVADRKGKLVSGRWMRCSLRATAPPRLCCRPGAGPQHSASAPPCLTLAEPHHVAAGADAGPHGQAGVPGRDARHAAARSVGRAAPALPHGACLSSSGHLVSRCRPTLRDGTVATPRSLLLLTPPAGVAAARRPPRSDHRAGHVPQRPLRGPAVLASAAQGGAAGGPALGGRRGGGAAAAAATAAAQPAARERRRQALPHAHHQVRANRALPASILLPTPTALHRFLRDA